MNTLKTRIAVRIVTLSCSQLLSLGGVCFSRCLDLCPQGLDLRLERLFHFLLGLGNILLSPRLLLSLCICIRRTVSSAFDGLELLAWLVCCLIFLGCGRGGGCSCSCSGCLLFPGLL